MSREFDLAIIGAGITGVGLFEAASRAGLTVLLLDKGLPGGQTTAVTSGLFHGGLRYLPYDAATSLVMGRQAGTLARRHSNLVARDVFLWPIYRGQMFGMETVETLLECYDDLSEVRGARRHVRLSAREAVVLEPGLEREGLLGALVFDEWSVRVGDLVTELIAAGTAAGGVVMARRRVTGFLCGPKRIEGILSVGPDGRRREHQARVVVNAGGPWAEEIASLAGCRGVELTLRKGVHLVFEGATLSHAVIFPDLNGRYIGLYPKGGETWAGPTDDPFFGNPESPTASPADEEHLKGSVARVLPAFAGVSTRMTIGLRPLYRQRGLSALFSRSHRILDHAAEGPDNLISVTGGKLTSFRAMAAETLGLVMGRLGRAPASSDETPQAPAGPYPLGLFESRSKLTLPLSAGLLAFGVARHALRRLSGTGRRGLPLYQRTYCDDAG